MSTDREQRTDIVTTPDDTDYTPPSDVVDPDEDEESPEHLNGKTWVSLIVFAAFVVFASGCMTGLWWG